MFRFVEFCFAAGLVFLPPVVFASGTPAGGAINPKPPEYNVSNMQSNDPTPTMPDRGNPSTEEAIGDQYWQGAADHARDRTEAVRHYRIAANRGLASAERKLAIAYANGDGAPADDGQMLRWQRKAAEAGDPVAAGMLGYAIMIGLDGSYDMVEAATWLTLAAEKPGPDAWRQHAANCAEEAQSKLTSAERQAFQARLAQWRSRLNGE